MPAERVHRGLELGVRAQAGRPARLALAASRSWDEVVEFIFHDWDGSVYDYAGNPLALFPAHLALATWDGPGTAVCAAGCALRSTGRQQLDNSGRSDRTIDPWTTIDLSLWLDLREARPACAAARRPLFAHLRNLGDVEYETWGYWYGENYYTPAAGRNCRRRESIAGSDARSNADQDRRRRLPVLPQAGRRGPSCSATARRPPTAVLRRTGWPGRTCSSAPTAAGHPYEHLPRTPGRRDRRLRFAVGPRAGRPRRAALPAGGRPLHHRQREGAALRLRTRAARRRCCWAPPAGAWTTPCSTCSCWNVSATACACACRATWRRWRARGRRARTMSWALPAGTHFSLLPLAGEAARRDHRGRRLPPAGRDARRRPAPRPSATW